MVLLFISLFTLVALALVFHFVQKNKQEKGCADLAENECCGAHEVCEKTSLLTMGAEVVYYDDEELDIFKTKKDNNYTVQEIRMFEEVLYTLQEEDVAGWLRSLQQRDIELPQNLRDAALLVISEKRGNEIPHLFKHF